MKNLLAILLGAILLVCALPIWPLSGTARIATEARVKAELAKDLAQPYALSIALSERICLDGRPVAGFDGDVIEYWVNFECPYCGIAEPLKAQRENSGLCIVVRHVPVSTGDSLKKAIAFEALKTFSVNAANRFWDAVIPKTSLAIPIPYEAALRSALDEALIVQDSFGEAVEKVAALVSGDIIASRERVTATPTYILEGLRFPACDFRADQLPTALELAKKVRSGDEDARKKATEMIVRGLLNEQLL